MDIKEVLFVTRVGLCLHLFLAILDNERARLNRDRTLAGKLFYVGFAARLPKPNRHYFCSMPLPAIRASALTTLATSCGATSFVDLCRHFRMWADQTRWLAFQNAARAAWRLRITK
jgi:hypothetical protein